MSLLEWAELIKSSGLPDCQEYAYNLLKAYCSSTLESAKPPLAQSPSAPAMPDCTEASNVKPLYSGIKQLAMAGIQTRPTKEYAEQILRLLVAVGGPAKRFHIHFNSICSKIESFSHAQHGWELCEGDRIELLRSDGNFRPVYRIKTSSALTSLVERKVLTRNSYIYSPGPNFGLHC